MNIKELFENLSAQVEQDVERKAAEDHPNIRFKRHFKNNPTYPMDEFFVNTDGYSANVLLSDENNNIQFELRRLENTGFRDEYVGREAYLIRVNNEVIEFRDTANLNVYQVWTKLEGIASLSQMIIDRFLEFTQVVKTR